jgi:hypothetical protein
MRIAGPSPRSDAMAIYRRRAALAFSSLLQYRGLWEGKVPRRGRAGRPLALVGEVVGFRGESRHGVERRVGAGGDGG